ncbi:MAG: tripartite tricarboxylate transporter TctB family protein [Eubacteriales bacterium]|nr:tripartite tricarboxylate transporter TctB family protein [Eubacteriales bacterium]
MHPLKTLVKSKSIQEVVLFLVMGVALLIHALTKHYAQAMPDWKMSPYLFPLLVAFLLILLSGSLLMDAIRSLKPTKQTEETVVDAPTIYWKKVLVVVIISLLYYLLMPLLTFIPSTILFLVTMFLYLGERRPLMIGLISVITAGSLYALFALGLNVMLP